LFLTIAIVIVIFCVSLYFTIGSAQRTGHITLLTVAEDETGTGGTADLSLTVKPGSGAIFIDSFPLTKVDTQSSVRYANQVACDILDEDCSRYDFFYTIRANSAVVGGPSAGAAIAVLTVAVLDHQEINQSIAVTGTINSGGIIGPVAGIRSKVEGARRAGLTMVLIPSLASIVDARKITSNESTGDDDTNDSDVDDIVVSPNTPAPGPNNRTVVRGDDSNDTGVDTGVGNFPNDGRNSRRNNDGIDDTVVVTTSSNETSMPPLSGKVEELSDHRMTVLRISTIEEATFQSTKQSYSRAPVQMTVPEDYTIIMSGIAEEICGRTMTLSLQLERRGLPYNDTKNFTGRIAVLKHDRYYSRASLCFSENIELSTILLQNATIQELRAIYRDTNDELQMRRENISNMTLVTISDLETYAIVQERLLESRELLRGTDPKNPVPKDLAYARERLVSAASWASFFNMKTAPVVIDDAHLQRACLAKLAEADERLSYMQLYLPELLVESERLLGEARSYSRNNPALCIFAASKAKAQADLMASTLSVRPEHVEALLDQKLAADRMVLVKQQEDGNFPILGYSYAQYAEDLREDAVYSALSFAEYALALSDLDIYFPQERAFHIDATVWYGLLLTSVGFLIGVIVVMSFAQSER